MFVIFYKDFSKDKWVSGFYGIVDSKFEIAYIYMLTEINNIQKDFNSDENYNIINYLETITYYF